MLIRIAIAILASAALLVSCKAISREYTQLETVMKSTERSKRRVVLVEPISHKGVQYEELRSARSRGFDQNGGVLRATDESTKDELWTLQVYKTEYDPQEEADVQDVYFTKLKVNWLGTTLTIINERKQTFKINIKDRSIVAK